MAAAEVKGELSGTKARTLLVALFVNAEVSIDALNVPPSRVAATASDSPMVTEMPSGEPVKVPLTATVQEIVEPWAGAVIVRTMGVGDCVGFSVGPGVAVWLGSSLKEGQAISNERRERQDIAWNILGTGILPPSPFSLSQR